MAANAEVLTLREQLQHAQESLDTLTRAVDALADATKRNRRWTRVLLAVSVAVVILTVFTGWFAITTRHDIREFGQRLFLSSCESTNDARATTRSSHTADAEGLIRITGADETDPDLANAYRAIVRQNNEDLKDRDCLAELDQAS